jgi:hypothetical protein
MPLHYRSSDLTLCDLWDVAQQELNGEAVDLEFSRDVVHKLTCPSCGREEDLFAPVGSVEAARARCLLDGFPLVVTAIHGFSGREDYGNRRLSELGLPLWDLFTARSPRKEIAILMQGDAPAVIGPLASPPRGS